MIDCGTIILNSKGWWRINMEYDTISNYLSAVSINKIKPIIIAEYPSDIIQPTAQWLPEEGHHQSLHLGAAASAGRHLCRSTRCWILLAANFPPFHCSRRGPIQLALFCAIRPCDTRCSINLAIGLVSFIFRDMRRSDCQKPKQCFMLISVFHRNMKMTAPISFTAEPTQISNNRLELRWIQLSWWLYSISEKVHSFYYFICQGLSGGPCIIYVLAFFYFS